jgi:hypothetical protein
MRKAMNATARLPLEETRKPLYRCIFSPDRVFRYVLEDSWDQDKGSAMFIGLNPSTADEYQLDPTLKRVRRWVDSWGLGGFSMLNLFAFRSPHPTVMQSAPDPEGPNNDYWLRRFAESSHLVVAAWGNGGAWKGRAEFVCELLSGVTDEHPRELFCLGLTRDGFPVHPLARGKHRVPEHVTPKPFTP